MDPFYLSKHANRLYPVQVSSKAQVEWGFYSNDDDTWVTVDKSILDVADDGVEKKIGFEGTPYPNTGFYCVRMDECIVGGCGMNLWRLTVVNVHFSLGSSTMRADWSRALMAGT